MEHGEETPLNLTDTGSSMMMDTLDNGSAMMVKQMVNGTMTMDPPQLELGGSKMTAPGSELSPLMSLIPLSNMTTVIMKNILAQISITDWSTQADMLASGTGKLGESVTI